MRKFTKEAQAQVLYDPIGEAVNRYMNPAGNGNGAATAVSPQQAAAAAQGKAMPLLLKQAVDQLDVMEKNINTASDSAAMAVEDGNSALGELSTAVATYGDVKNNLLDAVALRQQLEIDYQNKRQQIWEEYKELAKRIENPVTPAVNERDPAAMAAAQAQQAQGQPAAQQQQTASSATQTKSTKQSGFVPGSYFDQQWHAIHDKKASQRFQRTVVAQEAAPAALPEQPLYAPAPGQYTPPTTGTKSQAEQAALAKWQELLALDKQIPQLRAGHDARVRMLTDQTKKAENEMREAFGAYQNFAAIVNNHVSQGQQSAQQAQQLILQIRNYTGGETGEENAA